MASMNRLNSDIRAKCLHLLAEGVSVRAASRLTGVSKTTILKLIEDAGRAAAWYQDHVFRNLNSLRLQVDELWGFIHTKQKNVPNTKKAPAFAGDVWLWVATDADTELVPSWYVGGRGSDAAIILMDDLASRLAHRVQLTTDGKPYLEAVEGAFGGDIDYATLIKIYGPSPEGEKSYSPAECIGTSKQCIEGNPDPKHVSTSYAERNNLNVRMHSRRLTRLTNAFSKKVANHAHAIALHFLYYNFVRIHQTLKVSPAMAAGVTNRLWEMKDVAEMFEAWETAQLRQG
jgi:IS1 family transposase